jgi:hypothetical protein
VLCERCVSSQREVVELLAPVYIIYMLGIQNRWVIRWWCSYTLVYVCIVKLHIGILVQIACITN